MTAAQAGNIPTTRRQSERWVGDFESLPTDGLNMVLNESLESIRRRLLLSPAIRASDRPQVAGLSAQTRRPDGYPGPRTFRILIGLTLLLLSFLLAPQVAFSQQPAARPAQQLPNALGVLPSDAVLMVGTPNLQRLREHWNRCQLGQALNDRLMWAFSKHFRELIAEHWTNFGIDLGVTWQQLLDLPTGEAYVAVCRVPRANPNDRAPVVGRSSVVIVANIRNNLVQAQQTLATIDRSLRQQNSRVTQGGFPDEPRLDQAKTRFAVYQVPQVAKKQRPRMFRQRTEFCYFIRDGLLVIGTDWRTLKRIILSWPDLPQRPRLGALDKSPVFQGVMRRIQQDIGVAPPRHDLAVFARIVPLLALRRADFPNDKPAEDEIDVLRLARNQGFDAVQGLGGTIELVPGKTDTIIRAAAYAPKLPVDKGVRILTLPNSPNHQPPSFAPGSLSGFVSANWDTQKAFQSFGQLFDEALQDPGGWEDTIQGIEEAPNGPGINLGRDLVRLVGNQVETLSLVETPITVKSRQSVMALPSNNPRLLAQNIARSVRDDPNVKVKRFGQYTAYEFHEAPAEVRRRARAGKSAKPRPPRIICVAHDHLLIASQTGLLQQVLANPVAAQPLADNPAFLQVWNQLQQMHNGPAAIRAFINTREGMRLTFGLARQGKLQEEDSFFGLFLRTLIGANREQVRLNGKLLPPFNAIQGYFGMAGVYVITEPGSGWFAKAVFLRPQNQNLSAGAAAAAGGPQLGPRPPVSSEPVSSEPVSSEPVSSKPVSSE